MSCPPCVVSPGPEACVSKKLITLRLSCSVTREAAHNPISSPAMSGRPQCSSAPSAPFARLDHILTENFTQHYWIWSTYKACNAHMSYIHTIFINYARLSVFGFSSIQIGLILHLREGSLLRSESKLISWTADDKNRSMCSSKINTGQACQYYYLLVLLVILLLSFFPLTERWIDMSGGGPPQCWTVRCYHHWSPGASAERGQQLPLETIHKRAKRACGADLCV